MARVESGAAMETAALLGGGVAGEAEATSEAAWQVRVPGDHLVYREFPNWDSKANPPEHGRTFTISIRESLTCSLMRDRNDWPATDHVRDHEIGPHGPIRGDAVSMSTPSCLASEGGGGANCRPPPSLGICVDLWSVLPCTRQLCICS